MSEDGGITESQRRGGIGESFIEARLKSFAQVFRPLPLLEYAIDFYCRLLQNGKPSNKTFWVEAKSTSHFGNYWRESVEKETVVFWLNQVSPVFIIVYEESSDNCYWLSVEDNRQNWISKLQDGNRSITVNVDRSHILRKGKEQNSEFIQKIEKEIIRVNAVHGIPQFISKGYTGYAIGYIPILRLSDGARESISGTIRFGFNYLVTDSILRNDLQNAYRLCKLLADFDHGHYDHYLLLARICRQLGKRDEADYNYKTAIEICKADPNWDKKRQRDAPYIREIVARIERERLNLRM